MVRGGGDGVEGEAPGGWRDLWGAVAADRDGFALPARAIRALRMARVLAVPGLDAARRALADNPAALGHVARVAPGDRLFWLSHRAYLARGLGVRERAELAVAHYRHEAGRGAGYLPAVLGPGLVLWLAEAEGTTYDLRLMAGNDGMVEGGLSLVLHAGGERVCVVSFSWAPERVVLGGRSGALVPFVTRKQLTADRLYQPAFHRAFDRTTPAHLCLAALAGLAEAEGMGRMVGIAAARHPAVTPARLERFESAYDAFWAGMGGERASPLGYVMPLPPRLTPVEGMEKGRRRRALARRAHMAMVRGAARDAMLPFLDGDGGRLAGPAGRG